jgi:hypothetical protein
MLVLFMSRAGNDPDMEDFVPEDQEKAEGEENAELLKVLHVLRKYFVETLI